MLGVWPLHIGTQCECDDISAMENILQVIKSQKWSVLTSLNAFPVIFNSECQSGPSAPPVPTPVPDFVLFPFPFPVLECDSMVYLVLLSGLTSTMPPPSQAPLSFSVVVWLAR